MIIIQHNNACPWLYLDTTFFMQTWMGHVHGCIVFNSYIFRLNCMKNYSLVVNCTFNQNNVIVFSCTIYPVILITKHPKSCELFKHIIYSIRCYSLYKECLYKITSTCLIMILLGLPWKGKSWGIGCTLALPSIDADGWHGHHGWPWDRWGSHDNAVVRYYIQAIHTVKDLNLAGF